MEILFRRCHWTWPARAAFLPPAAFAVQLTRIGACVHAQQGFIIDMDGVIYHGANLLPGAKPFLAYLKKEGTSPALRTRCRGRELFARADGVSACDHRALDTRRPQAHLPHQQVLLAVSRRVRACSLSAARTVQFRAQPQRPSGQAGQDGPRGVPNCSRSPAACVARDLPSPPPSAMP